MKIMTIVGTRPEIIRLSAVIPRLDEQHEQVLVHTGQNYDYELNQVFFDDLGLRAPDRYLGVDTSTVGTTYGGVIAGSEAAMLEEQPDAVVILGDTNSALAAVMARRLGITIFHMEAGNRCFDWAVPEEMNRRIVDHVSHYNLVYTEHARRNLIREGIAANTIIKTGSPMNEVLAGHRTSIDASTILSTLELTPGNYYLASLHRQENVDDENVCRALFGALDAIATRDSLPVVLSTHPRTRNRLESFGIVESARLRFLKPFGFHDYNHLQLHARAVISDSGTISEEAALLGFPGVSPRSATERPEGLEAGCFILAPRTTEGVLGAVDDAVARFARSGRPPIPEDYAIANTSDIVLGSIASYAQR